MNTILSATLAIAFLACAQPARDNTTSETGTTSTITTSSAAAAVQPATTATTATTTASEENRPMSDYQNKVAELHTTAGEIDIVFFPDKAPNHVKNFIDLAKKGFYNGIKFHRVIPGFMIQVGDPNTISGPRSTWGTGGSPNKLKAEFSDIHHARGILSMARTNDPNSASSQFFICVADAPSLDRQYTVFGKVIKGMEVADKIVNAPRDANDQPEKATAIERIVIRDAKPGETS